jgi:hypothetical protein
VVSDERDDVRAEALARGLSAPLDARRTANARERVWSAVTSQQQRPRRSGAFPALAAFGLAALILVAGGWLQSYRIDVGHPGTQADDFGPFLYREEVARVSFAGLANAGLANGALVVKQRHVDEPRRGRLSVVLEASAAFASAPAAMELRYRETGTAVSQVLVRKTTDGGDTELEAVVPLPEHDLGDVRTYDVWLHLEGAAAADNSAIITIEVSERPEGQRARLIGYGP